MMNNTDRIYILMEILGHDISKSLYARKQQILTSPEYAQVFKDLWMMRVQQGESAQHITKRVELLKNRQVSSYFDVATLAKEIEVVSQKGNEQIVINPYIFNSYRHYPVKTVGELRIPYAKTIIDINEYIMGAEIASERKIRFLTNFANEWYAIAQYDITHGIMNTTDNIRKLDNVHRFRFPFLTIVKWTVALLLFVFLFGVFFATTSGFQQIIQIKPKRDYLMFASAYLFMFTAFATYLVASINKMRGRHYYLSVENKVHQNLGKYKALLSDLAKRHDFMLKAIEKAVNNRTFLRLSFNGVGVLTPLSYAFDTYNFDSKIISKKEYVRMHRVGLILNVVLFVLTLMSFVLYGLVTTGVI